MRRYKFSECVDDLDKEILLINTLFQKEDFCKREGPKIRINLLGTFLDLERKSSIQKRSYWRNTQEQDVPIMVDFSTEIPKVTDIELLVVGRKRIRGHYDKLFEVKKMQNVQMFHSLDRLRGRRISDNLSDLNSRSEFRVQGVKLMNKFFEKRKERKERFYEWDELKFFRVAIEKLEDSGVLDIVRTLAKIQQNELALMLSLFVNKMNVIDALLFYTEAITANLPVDVGFHKELLIMIKKCSVISSSSDFQQQVLSTCFQLFNDLSASQSNSNVLLLLDFLTYSAILHPMSHKAILSSIVQSCSPKYFSLCTSGFFCAVMIGKEKNEQGVPQISMVNSQATMVGLSEFSVNEHLWDEVFKNFVFDEISRKRNRWEVEKLNKVLKKPFKFNDGLEKEGDLPRVLCYIFYFQSHHEYEVVVGNEDIDGTFENDDAKRGLLKLLKFAKLFTERGKCFRVSRINLPHRECDGDFEYSEFCAFKDFPGFLRSDGNKKFGDSGYVTDFAVLEVDGEVLHEDLLCQLRIPYPDEWGIIPTIFSIPKRMAKDLYEVKISKMMNTQGEEEIKKRKKELVEYYEKYSFIIENYEELSKEEKLASSPISDKSNSPDTPPKTRIQTDNSEIDEKLVVAEIIPGLEVRMLAAIHQKAKIFLCGSANESFSSIDSSILSDIESESSLPEQSPGANENKDKEVGLKQLNLKELDDLDKHIFFENKVPIIFGKRIENFCVEYSWENTIGELWSQEYDSAPQDVRTLSNLMTQHKEQVGIRKRRKVYRKEQEFDMIFSGKSRPQCRKTELQHFLNVSREVFFKETCIGVDCRSFKKRYKIYTVPSVRKKNSRKNDSVILTQNLASVRIVEAIDRFESHTFNGASGTAQLAYIADRPVLSLHALVGVTSGQMDSGAFEKGQYEFSELTSGGKKESKKKDLNAIFGVTIAQSFEKGQYKFSELNSCHKIRTKEKQKDEIKKKVVKVFLTDPFEVVDVCSMTTLAHLDLITRKESLEGRRSPLVRVHRKLRWLSQFGSSALTRQIFSDKLYILEHHPVLRINLKMAEKTEFIYPNPYEFYDDDDDDYDAIQDESGLKREKKTFNIYQGIVGIKSIIDGLNKL